MQGKRLQRVNQVVKEEISMLLLRELKDPRLGFVTITDVETAPDLRSAKVFVSVLGNEEQWNASMAGLESAKGFIRNWLRRHLDLRATPTLDFRADHSIERGANIQTLLRRLQRESPP
jgi:ribosome-binding factor A